MQGMMDVDKDVLISKVFSKSIIWDRRLKGHANRSLVDKAWQEIAVEMDVEDDWILRKKWKYLRDQFAVEVGKFPPRSDDSGDLPESKWHHFKSLMFLLDVVKPRASSRNWRSSNSSQNQEKNVEPVAHINENNDTLPTEEVQEIECPVSHIQSSQQTQQDYSTQVTSPSSEKFSGKRKQTNLIAKYNQQLLFLEEEEAPRLKRVRNERVVSAENDDELFFRSLLPHVSQIPQHLKLRFRNRVQLLVDEFAYGPVSQPREYIQQYSPEHVSLTGCTETDTSNSSSSHVPPIKLENVYED